MLHRPRADGVGLPPLLAGARPRLMSDSQLVKLGSMKMPRRAIVLVLLFLAIGAAFAAYHWMAPRRTPPGQRPLADLTPATLPALRESFNGASGATRVLVMLSPT